jgi:CheY-like chemotaxis protein
MSYPSLLRALVIEDQPEVKETYDTIFQRLGSDFPFAPPAYAFCFDDAVRHLDSSKIFHLVLLDLRLPRSPGLPAEDVQLGLSLLEKCLARHYYPIPSLLVISAYISKTDQLKLDASLREGFYFGRRVVKGGDVGQLENEIREGLAHARRYCQVGVHLRDADAKVFPTLSPGEDDLLRRSALEQLDAIGLDLEWWSAEYAAPHSRPAISMGWTKVLMGRFIHEDSPSRPMFFKFVPSDGASFVIESSRRMAGRLSHVKAVSARIGPRRALIVTEKVGASNRRPISLADYLDSSDAQGSRIPAIAKSIADQIQQLGDRTPQVKPIRGVLWKSHDAERIGQQFHLHGGQRVLEDAATARDPAETFQALIKSDVLLRFEQQNYVHGDLNVTNVALDQDGNDMNPYIFDAAGGGPCIDVWDLAALEISVLLHQRTDASVVEPLADLYADGSPDFSQIPSTHLQATAKLVIEIRKQALQVADLKSYAIAVFDNALIQLGGLAFGLSTNKISIPRDAALVSGLTAAWVVRLLPEITAIHREDEATDKSGSSGRS